MDETIKKVAEFHDAFQQQNASQIEMLELSLEEERDLLAVYQDMAHMAQHLHWLAEKRKSPVFLRLQLCQEELGELAEAMLDKDPVAALDALCDMRYVADGTTLTLGLQHIFNAAFDEVHRSNMTKLDVDGKPVINSSGRVVKGPLFEEPDLHQFVYILGHTQVGHLPELEQKPRKRWLDWIRS